jgi:predicted nucleic acid-binding Zn ribbon protein
MTFRGDNNRPLKDWLRIFSQSPHLRSRLYQTRVEKLWEEKMGPVIQSYTRRIRLDGQVLFIYVESAPLKAELSTMKDSILRSVNEALGEDYVKEVRIF